MPIPNDIYEKALTLKPLQKARLIDKLISSLDRPISRMNYGPEKRKIALTLTKVEN
jgi:hypothetical protein